MDNNDRQTQKHNYFSRYLIGPAVNNTIAQASSILSEVKFDTFVTIGLSGATAGGILAHALGKNLYVIRKQEDSTHDNITGFGVMGTQWVFLDDFVSSGRTYKNVIKRLSELHKDGTFSDYEWKGGDVVRQDHPLPEHVGGYFYNQGEFKTLEETIRSCCEWSRV